jgi:RNA polymerase sigma-70 factor (ECF subfamily)
MSGAKGQTDTAQEAAAREAAARRDAELVERLKGGDAKALDELFRRYREPAYQIAYRLLGNAEDALDVVQEAFIHVMRGVEGFRGQASFKTWFYRIVTHAALDFRRARSVRQTASLDTESAPEPPAERHGEWPPDEVEMREFLDAIDRALMNVSEKNRAALVLYALEGMSYKEVAEVLGISVGTVMSRIFNARQRLRELLDPEIG